MIVGCLGAGQLGQMLANAGRALEIETRFFDAPSAAGEPPPPAAQVAPFTAGDFGDVASLEAFARGVDVATYEFENVPVAAAQTIERIKPVFPPPRALEISQDRVAEKAFFASLHIPTPPWRAVGTLAALDAAVSEIGLPCVLKTRRMGYDGKGQAVIRATSEVANAWDALGAAAGAAGLILEAFVPFVREVSMLSVRSRSGDIRCYPLVQNHHEGGILRLSIAPAPGEDEALTALAQGHARRALEALDYAGVLCIEFFETRGPAGQPTLLANETACRVHNSGHWTIEGARTSQFENHLRAITGLPLGATAMVSPGACAAMINIIGDAPTQTQRAAALAIEGGHLHMYGKAPRAGRKLGHYTLVAPNAQALDHRLAAARSALGR